MPGHLYYYPVLREHSKKGGAAPTFPPLETLHAHMVSLRQLTVAKVNVRLCVSDDVHQLIVRFAL